MQLELTVNGGPVQVEAEARVVLVDLLREGLGLTGTKVGCDTGQCGTCVVDVDGRSAKSCTLLAAQVRGSTVTTVEGLAEAGGLSALQRAIAEHHGVQCGFCIPGMLLSLRDLLDHVAAPDEATIRSWMTGNLCRCTGYQSLVRAVQSLVTSRGGA